MYSRLLWQFLEPGAHVASENRLTVSLAPNPGAQETILLFDKLDSRGLPRSFPGDNKTCCDALFYYKRNRPSGDGNILIFVELKSSDVEHAIEQLKNTIQHVWAAMHSECKPKSKIGAVVVTKGNVPPVDERKRAREFREESGAFLWFEPGSLGKEATLRSYVDKLLARP
jgi:hypothetical protein